MVKQNIFTSFFIHTVPCKGCPIFSVLQVKNLRLGPREARNVDKSKVTQPPQTLAVSPRHCYRKCSWKASWPRVPRRDQRSHKIPRPGQRSPPWTLVTHPPAGGAGTRRSQPRTVCPLRLAVLGRLGTACPVALPVPSSRCLLATRLPPQPDPGEASLRSSQR